MLMLLYDLFRGAIHRHCLLNFPQGPSAPDQAVAFDTHRPVQEIKDNIMVLQENMEKRIANGEDTAGDDFLLKNLNEEIENARAAGVAREKAIKFFVQDLGLSELHPNLVPSNWKPPYGQNRVKPKVNVLRQPLGQNMTSSEELHKAYERLVNRVNNHECRFRQVFISDNMYRVFQRKLFLTIIAIV